MSNPDIPFFEGDDITYHFENIQFDFTDKSIITSWLKASITSYHKKLNVLNFIFCNDHYLHDLNVKYLNHDTFTDVITFSYSDENIEGDIFISIDRIRENSNEFGISFNNELYRVMIHGVLHLVGFNDKTSKEKENMTKMENVHLAILNGMILDKK